MTDRPIIFSPTMIRALLAGTKTQTRRILRDEVPDAPAMDEIAPKGTVYHPAPYLDAYCGQPMTRANPRGMSDRWCWWTRDDRPGHTFRVPHVPGDRLWVREGFVRYHDLDGDDMPCSELMTCYRADGWPCDGWYDCDREETRDAPPWRPSIHMPRGLSRLTLRVTEVRVQRLQDISEADAIAEGVERSERFPDRFLTPAGDYAIPIVAFQRLWTSIHGPDAWAANPWVSANTFTVHHANIDTPALGVAA